MNLSIREKIHGAIFGYAIGDALGLGTEFMSTGEVARRYPDGLHDYSNIIRDAHRAQWKHGEWTNDTEMVLIILESIARCGRLNYLDIAKELKKWYESSPVDLTHNMRLVFKHANYTTHPFESAEEAWSNIGFFDNSSECLGRAVFSFLSYYPLETATNLCRLTHPGTRAILCCRVIAHMAESLMRTGNPSTYEELCNIVHENNKDILPYLDTARYGTIEDFDLDDDDTYWFVRKALGAAIWCVWHCDSFESGINAIIAQGGDADTNAAAAGALLGIQYGFSSIPQSLIDGLIGKERLNNVADNILKYIDSKPL